MTGVNIHPTAIVGNGARLGKDVTVGPYAVIGPKVSIGEGCTIGAHAVVDGNTSLGCRNLVSPFASIGSRPQDLKYRDEDTLLQIGDDNQFREYCNVSLGTAGGGGITRIGSKNLFMVFTHVAHDCVIENQTIVANGVAIAGHVSVGDGAVLGGLCAIHQFCRIGSLAMIAGGAMVAQDVVPYGMVHGDRATINGLNVVGLRRIGAKADDLKSIKEMYHLVFDSNLLLAEAVRRIESEVEDSKHKTLWLEFLKKGDRGICR
ncbi:MAG: acyl-ACP--UDP-N-acetylglucosamine O-acyltransferase [Proteobacteria bacterium]|nr:acyl-ACP--UDP-N-acetylglucosamine O-acyltransferase [Pseudomonadota bacterium]